MQVILNDIEAKEFFGLREENSKLKATIAELQSKAVPVSTQVKQPVGVGASGNTTHLDQLKAKQDELEIPAVFRSDFTGFPTPGGSQKTVQTALPTMETVQKKVRFDWQPYMNTIKSIVNEDRISRRTFTTLLNTFPKGGRVDAKFLRAKLLALGVAIDEGTGTLSWDMTKANRHPLWKTI